MKKEKIKRNKNYILFTSLILTVFFIASGAFFPGALYAGFIKWRAPLVGQNLIYLGDVYVGKNTTHNLSFFNPHLSSIKWRDTVDSGGCSSINISSGSIPPLSNGTVVVSTLPTGMGLANEVINLSTSEGNYSFTVSYVATRTSSRAK